MYSMSGDADQPPEPVLKNAARGYRSTLATQVVRVGCKVISIVVMARLVAPTGYGNFAMAASVFWLLALFRDAGLGTAAIQAKKLNASQMTNLFWAQLIIGVVVAGLMWGMAPWAARWYRTDAIIPLVQVMSLAFVIIGLGGFMRTQLLREMRIARANRLEAIAAVVATFFMIVAGLLNAGAFSFVVFLIVSESVASGLAWRETTWRPSGRPNGRGLGQLWRVGYHITVHQSLTFLLSQLDSIAIGRWFGAHMIGLYNRTGQLLTLPTQYVAGPFGQVMLATLSRLKPNSPEFKQHAWNTVGHVSCLILPIYAVCIVLPEPTIQLLLGSDWLEAAALLRALAIGGAATAVTSLAQSVNVALGRTDRLIGAALIALPFLVAAIAWGAPHGVQGIANGIAGAHVLIALPRLWWLLRDFPGAFRSYCACLFLPVGIMIGFMVGLALGQSLVGNAAVWWVQLVAALPTATTLLILATLASPTLRRQFTKTWNFVTGRQSLSPDQPSS